MRSSRDRWIVSALYSLAVPAIAESRGAFQAEQRALPASVTRAVTLDSGWVTTADRSEGPRVVFSRDLTVPGAPWLRLYFDSVELPGLEGSGEESLLVLTASDGAMQVMNARHLRQWQNTTAYFNGSVVRVEIVSYPGTGAARVVVSSVEAGQTQPDERSICGGTDDRTLSSDPRVARIVPTACTAWLIDDANRTLVSAGHCGISGSNVVQFNVPLSTSTGSIVHPPPEDQYAVDPSSVQWSQASVGDDWAYFGVFPNTNTGLTPFQAQGQSFVRASAYNPGAGAQVRITGYGTVYTQLPATWNYVQKTGIGDYLGLSGAVASYSADTTGGNSGSPVILESTGKVIAVHNGGSCSMMGGANTGTALQCSRLQAAFSAPRGVCATGAIGVPNGPLFAIGDLANNLGTIDRTSGWFSRVAAPTSVPSGLAFRRPEDRFYTVDSQQRLVRLHPATGAGWILGTITGAPGMISDLAYDARADRLLGICRSSGQLVWIDTNTRVVTLIGSPGGGNIRGLTSITGTGQLLGIDNAPGGTRLVAINRVTGQQSVIGSLGLGLMSCASLVWCDDARVLYTIDPASHRLYKVDRLTGAATLVGETGALWTTSGGMAYRRLENVCFSDANLDGKVDVADLSLMLLRWGQNVVPGSTGDFSGDGVVGVQDLVLLCAVYGCGGTSQSPTDFHAQD